MELCAKPYQIKNQPREGGRQEETMNHPRVGLVGVTCRYESGGQRAEELLSGIKTALEKKNLEVVCAEKVAWDTADAIDVCRQLKKEELDALVIVEVTWIMDSMQYIFINELKLPTVFWAVPYTETFSIGCVQHFGSILKAQGMEYEYVYGLPEEDALTEKVKSIAEAGQIIRAVRGMRLALVGPRQTWRVAGPQDMSMEEWEFSRKFGVTLVHVEMSEITELADSISDKDAEKKLECLSKRTGKVLADHETMLHMVKIYLATKEIIRKYSLDALAAECYPMYSGLMNLTSSWLADEGIIVDTEGDIGHTMVMYMLNLAAKGGVCALGEVGSMDDVNNILSLAHEGSTAHSLAESLDKVQISPSGDRGTFVGVPLKTMDCVTVSSIVGGKGKYKLLVEKADVVEPSREEWIEGGEKLLVKLHVAEKASTVVDKLMEKGMDHHLLVKEGDHRAVLSAVCKYLGVEKVTL